MPITQSRPPTSLDGAVVLLVDDEPAVLTGLTRLLRGSCVVHTATDPVEALQLVGELVGLTAVISDMRMPGMDGATFLSKVRELAPDTVRILLTGQADVNAAVAAINDGRIFRFLWKPCPPQALHDALHDAAEHYRLVTAERELLEKTLRGSVRALLETLSLANPLAFSRAERIRTRVGTIVAHLDAADTWQVEVATMLSQLGAVTLPPAVTERLHRGERLAPANREIVSRIPHTSVGLLSDVPRLDDVREIIQFQEQRYDGRGPVNHLVRGEDIPLGSRVIRAAADYDAYEARGVPSRVALAEMREDVGVYDPQILDVLENVVTIGEDATPVEQLPLDSLRSGHVLAADLVTSDGVLLCGRGQEVTQRLIDRLENWRQSHQIVEPVHVQFADR